MERCHEIIADGGCELDKGWTGPLLDLVPSSSKTPQFQITESFVNEMLELYKQGKSLPRRIVWEIVLGCQHAIAAETSMVEVALDEGITCDVIGDTHGT